MAVSIEGPPSYHATRFNDSAYGALHPDHASIMAPQSLSMKKEVATDQDIEVKSDLQSLKNIPKISEFSPRLFITGMGSQYPPFTFKPEQLEKSLKKWYDVGIAP